MLKQLLRFRAKLALGLDLGVDAGSREENASDQRISASVLIQSEPDRLQLCAMAISDCTSTRRASVRNPDRSWSARGSAIEIASLRIVVEAISMG
jgi:hypothetical protein